MASSPPVRTTRGEPLAGGLAVSRYDQVASMLVSLLIVLGVVTLMMFLVWLSGRIFWVTPSVPVNVLEDVGGGGSGSGPLTGGQGELEAPSLDEIGATASPAPVDQAIGAMGAIAAVVSSRSADLDVLEGDTTPGAGLGHGEGTGVGDGRGKGPGGPGTADGVPAYERWEVRMSATSLTEYAKQLDFFKVELGVAGGGVPTVEYISNLSADKPTVRTGQPKDERRLRLLHRSGELRQADRQLAAKAGVKADGRIIFQFYDQQTYQLLLTLENARKGNRRIAEVRRTIFGVKENNGRYEFYVIDQQFVGGA
jgi:hypothetical protein